MNTKEDNKDVQLLKDKLWQRKTTAKVTIMKEDNKRRKQDPQEDQKKRNKGE